MEMITDLVNDKVNLIKELRFIPASGVLDGITLGLAIGLPHIIIPGREWVGLSAWAAGFALTKFGILLVPSQSPKHK